MDRASVFGTDEDETQPTQKQSLTDSSDLSTPEKAPGDLQICAELAEIIDRWESLPAEVKQSIIEQVRNVCADNQ